jgi:hypothetical protein
MGHLHIASTRNTPMVDLDLDQRRFQLVGHSLPENASQFYAPILDWLQTHLPSVEVPCTFEFNLPYFNSSSLKAIYLLLQTIKSGVDRGQQFTVKWFVEPDDDFMTEACETFQEMVDMDIQMLTLPEQL